MKMNVETSFVFLSFGDSPGGQFQPALDAGALA